MAEAACPVAALCRKAQRLSPAQRQRVADLIDALLAILDADDGDLDAEPSLGWSRTYATGRHDADPLLCDLEAA